jgi:hypothetical protein
MNPVATTKVDLEKRTITIGGCEAAPNPVIANEVGAVALWQTKPEWSWSSCAGCPDPMTCLMFVQCIRELRPEWDGGR